MSLINAEVTPPQYQIMSSPKRFKIVNAGRRFGKSFLSGYLMLIKALSKPNAIIWYIAPTLPMARKIMWDGWLEEHVPKQYIEKSNSQMMTIKFKNGSRIYCLSATDIDSLRGTGIDLMIIDEAAMIENNEFWQTIRPNLADGHRDGECLIISTPKGYNWFYDLFMKAKSDPALRDLWDTFQFTTIDGGNVPLEEIELSKKEMTAKMFQQEYYASFETMSNRIYYNFDRSLNVIEKDECEEWFGKSGEIHVGIDFNVNPMTAAIFAECKDNGRNIAICFDEIVEPNSDTQHLCDTLKRRYPHCDIYAYPDPTCRKRQTNASAGQTDMSIIQNSGIHVRVPHAPYASKDKWNTVNTALANAKGERSIFLVRDACPHLVKAWEGYVYKDSGEPDKSGGLDHISDAAAYYINYEFPAKSRRITKPKLLGV